MKKLNFLQRSYLFTKQKIYKQYKNIRNDLQQSYNEMGNENIIKDANIQIFLELKSLIYKSGQKIKGCIYLQVQEYSPYSELVLALECFEKTQLKDKKDKHGQLFTQQRTTYSDKIKVHSFQNGLYQGHHQFPFTLTLPISLPGSLLLTPNDYIRYRLSAYLQSTSPALTNQLHSRQIWILEQFQSPVEPIFAQHLQQPKCCMFGYSWGWVKTQTECQLNCVQPGQKVKLKIEINTHRLNTKINYTKVRLLQKTFSATHQFYAQNQVSQLFSYDFNQDQIEKIQIKKMEKCIVFSLDLLPTAIGQILSRFYVIEIQLVFACYSEIKQTLHIFVASEKNCIQEENKPFAKPKNWKAQKYDKVTLDKLKKYDYKPHAEIPFQNMPKQESNKLEAMKISQPESERKIRV